MAIGRKLAFVGAVVAGVLASGYANAAIYNFGTIWDGSAATAAFGSDPMVGTNILVGDSFTYTLSAAGDGAWQSNGGGAAFPLGGLFVSELASRTVNFTFSLLNNNATVFTVSENLSIQSFIHLGTNTIDVPASLTFDQLVVNVALLAITTGTDSTIGSLLPIFGAPEQSSGFITFSATGAVPEPATWAMMLMGFAALGCGARRRREAEA